MDSPIQIKDFCLQSAYPCNGYITSIDVVNNIVAVTDSENTIYVFDLYAKKKLIECKVADIPIVKVSLLKKYNQNSENGDVNFDIEECLFIDSGVNTKQSHIFHFDLKKRKIIHKFRFQCPINENGFALHPKTHIFIVTLKNRQLEVYKINEKICIYSSTVQSDHCIPCFNKMGIIYACSEHNYIYLYSSYADEYTGEHFAKFDISQIITDKCDYCIHIDFSYDDKKIILASSSHKIYTVDAFNGTILQGYNFKNDVNLSQKIKLPLFRHYPTFSFDSNFIISGGKDHYIHVWHIDGNYVCRLPCNNYVLFVKWMCNRNAFIATTKYILLWQLPKNLQNLGFSL